MMRLMLLLTVVYIAVAGAVDGRGRSFPDLRVALALATLPSQEFLPFIDSYLLLRSSKPMLPAHLYCPF